MRFPSTGEERPTTDRFVTILPRPIRAIQTSDAIDEISVAPVRFLPAQASFGRSRRRRPMPAAYGSVGRSGDERGTRRGRPSSTGCFEDAMRITNVTIEARDNHTGWEST